MLAALKDKFSAKVYTGALFFSLEQKVFFILYLPCLSGEFLNNAVDILGLDDRTFSHQHHVNF